MTLNERLKRARKDLSVAQTLASNSTSDAASRVYESRIDEYIKILVSVEAEYKAQGIPIPPYEKAD